MQLNLQDAKCECNGKFIFSPRRPGLKKVHRSFDNAIILKVDNSISSCYSWFLNRELNIDVQKPMWGTHITVVSDKDRVTDIEKFNRLKDTLNGKEILVPYNVDVQKQFQFWVLRVTPTEEMIDIRRQLGLKENYPFHITVGRDWDRV